MKGTLTLKLPLFGFELSADFADSRGDSYKILASTRTVVNAAARHTSVSGTLTRDEMQIGDVELQVDWNLVKKALPSPHRNRT